MGSVFFLNVHLVTERLNPEFFFLVHKTKLNDEEQFEFRAQISYMETMFFVNILFPDSKAWKTLMKGK